MFTLTSESTTPCCHPQLSTMSQANSTANNNINKKQFVCGQCGADFVYQSGLQRHMAQKHNTKPPASSGAASPYALNPNSLRAQHMQRMQNMQQQTTGGGNNNNPPRPQMGSAVNANNRPMSGAPSGGNNNSSTATNSSAAQGGGLGSGFPGSFHQPPGRPVPPPPGTDPNVKHFVDNREVNIFTIPREAARPAPPPPSRDESECDCPAHMHARAQQQQQQQGGPPRPRTAPPSSQPGQDDGSDDEYEPMSDIEALKRIVMKMAYEINHLRNKCSLHDKILLHMYPVFAEKMGKNAPPPPQMRTPGDQQPAAEPDAPNGGRD